jgi:Rad3-related DNA helicase
MTFDPFKTDDTVKPAGRGRGSVDPRTFPFKATLIKRAETRYYKGLKNPQFRIVQVDDNEWIVPGDVGKSDTYAEYNVIKVVGDNKTRHVCSCSDHVGGQYRQGMCSHALAVMICAFEEGNTWPGSKNTTSPTTETDTPSAGNKPASPTQLNPPPTDITASNADSSTASSPSDGLRRRRKIRKLAGANDGTTTTNTDSPPPTTSSSPDPSSTPADSAPVTIVPGSLPSWVSTLRPLQIDAVDEIAEAFEDVDVVFYEGPTGAGKSLVAQQVANRLGIRGVIASADKMLQRQYLEDFEEVGARTIMGRANYTPQIPTVYDEATFKDVDVTCGDCDYSGGLCTYCPEVDLCNYRTAKQKALDSPLAVVNYAYLLGEANSAYPQFSGQQLIICDECDVLEEILLGQAEVSYSQRLRRDLKLGQPSKLGDETGDTWLEWLKETVMPALDGEVDRLKFAKRSIERSRRLKFLKGKLADTDVLIETMQDGDDLNWVLSGYKQDRNKKLKDGPMIFKPIRVGQYGHRLLWRHSHKFLLMSATIVSSEELADTLGYQREYATVVSPMPFDIERREVHYVPVAAVTRNTKEEALPKIVAAVLAVLDQWPGERAIIHTVSYELTEMVRASIVGATERKVFTYKDTSEKDNIIRQFTQTESGVLVGPSIGRGTDFKGNKARINIICKVPYLSLADAQVKARLYAKGGQLWYSTKAIREIVQASGRTTRSEDDWGVTYIFDSSFGRLLKENRHLMPGWFEEALRTTIKPQQLLAGRPIPKPQFTSEGNQ